MPLYKSKFEPFSHGLNVLIKGKMLAPGETPSHMVERVVDALIGAEDNFGTSQDDKDILAQELGRMLDEHCFVMSTPIITNAGRYADKPLSACTVPSLDLAHDDVARIRKVVTHMHEDGMGTGFSLNDL